MVIQRRTVLAGMAAGMLGPAGVHLAEAQQPAAAAYPSRPVKLIVPFSPGAATDILARTVAEKLTEGWPQPVVVENRTGASGNIGADAVAKSAPDGHTLLMGTIGTNAVNASIFPGMPYDTLTDFAPVALVATVPMLLVIHPSLPARDVQELIRLARERPGRLNFGTAGLGTSQHLAEILFESLTGVRMEVVTYRGFSALIPDLLQNTVNLTIGDPVSILPPVRAGQLRALAVTTRQRHPLLPEVPTMAEAGVEGYEAAAWYGIFAPTGTDPALVARLNREIVAILHRPEVDERIRQLGAVPAGGSPQEFTAFVRAEHDRWGRLVRAAGVKAQ